MKKSLYAGMAMAMAASMLAGPMMDLPSRKLQRQQRSRSKPTSEGLREKKKHRLKGLRP